MRKKISQIKREGGKRFTTYHKETLILSMFLCLKKCYSYNKVSIFYTNVAADYCHCTHCKCPSPL